MRHVLFVCNHNAGRSQMAEAFFNRIAPTDVRARSAGTQPNHEVWPEVVDAMQEIGIDLTGSRPQRLDIDMQLRTDWAVTMGCGDACPYVPTRVEEWDVADPAGRPRDEVRAIRDEIEQRVHDLVDSRLDAIRVDRTAHQLRVARLLPDLAEEFADRRDPAEIRACLDAILNDYDDVPVRSFMLTLAHRRTRECLRRETCDVLHAA